jgi:hypothetical protein
MKLFNKFTKAIRKIIGKFFTANLIQNIIIKIKKYLRIIRKMKLN